MQSINLVDNQYLQTSETLYTFTSNKSYAYSLNIEPKQFNAFENSQYWVWWDYHSIYGSKLKTAKNRGQS